MVWVILWTLELRRKKKTTIYLVDAFFFKWNCLYSRLDPRHSFFWSHVSKGHCWLSVRGRPPHQALRHTFSHLILVPWVEDREDTAGPLGQKGRNWDESSGFLSFPSPCSALPSVWVWLSENIQRGPVAQWTNMRHPRNGQDVEYVSFFVSLIFKNSSLMFSTR